MKDGGEKHSRKLFGKLNVIDILIIIVLIAAVALLGLRFGLGKGRGGKQHVRVSYYGFSGVHDYVPEHFTSGDKLMLYSTEEDLGELTDFRYAPAYSLVYDQQRGETVKVPVEGESFVWFTAECYGKLGPDGLTIDDVTFVVGGNYYINVGPTRAGYQITNFELID